MVREFRDFLLRGNVIDLAVAVVIGAAFGAVITSFVGEHPDAAAWPVGRAGLLDAWRSRRATASVRYGLFLNALLSFVLIALAIFLFVVKPMNALAARRAGAAEGEPTTKPCPYCASEIAIAATRCPMCTSQLSESA